jgi:hypothetical protein
VLTDRAVSISVNRIKVKVKVKFTPIAGHEGPEEE